MIAEAAHNHTHILDMARDGLSILSKRESARDAINAPSSVVTKSSHLPPKGRRLYPDLDPVPGGSNGDGSTHRDSNAEGHRHSTLSFSPQEARRTIPPGLFASGRLRGRPSTK